jgi:hypothetical protein
MTIEKSSKHKIIKHLANIASRTYGMVNGLNAVKRMILSAAADELVLTYAPWRRIPNAYFGFNPCKSFTKKIFDDELRILVRYFSILAEWSTNG